MRKLQEENVKLRAAIAFLMVDGGVSCLRFNPRRGLNSVQVSTGSLEHS